MIQALAFLALGLSCVAALTAEQSRFVGFTTKFGKVYESNEVMFQRFNIFRDNLKYVEQHNAGVFGNFSYTLGVNRFSDLTFEEFSAKHIGLGAIKPKSKLAAKMFVPAVPNKAVDWRTKGAVTPVKDQAPCGSCWAFSSTGGLEGAFAVKTGQLTSLSEQQLLDCSLSYGNGDCTEGGLMVNAFNYVIDHGLCKEDDYTYDGELLECRSSKCQPQVQPKSISYDDATPFNEASLQSFVDARPTTIAVSANRSFQHYVSGVFDAPCKDRLNHAILAVGYDTSPATGKPYWIVKNSWGTTWGEQGYIRLVAGIDQCGLTQAATGVIVL